MEYILENRYVFIFVLIRVSMIFSFGIFFGDKRISKTVKFAMIFLLTTLLAPTIDISNVSSMTQFEFTTTLIQECFIGFTIGFISNFIMQIPSMAGSLIDTQGGFGMAQIFDPSTQSQSSVVSQLMTVIGTLCFVLNDLHITFLEIIIDTFNSIPIGANLTPDSIFDVIQILTTFIGIAVCIALPVVGIIFMIDVILGISTKTMPQLNIFSVGFIVKIFTTMILMYIYSMMMNKFILFISNIVFDFIQQL